MKTRDHDQYRCIDCGWAGNSQGHVMLVRQTAHVLGTRISWSVCARCLARDAKQEAKAA